MMATVQMLTQLTESCNLGMNCLVDWQGLLATAGHHWQKLSRQQCLAVQGMELYTNNLPVSLPEAFFDNIFHQHTCMLLPARFCRLT